MCSYSTNNKNPLLNLAVLFLEVCRFGSVFYHIYLISHLCNFAA